MKISRWGGLALALALCSGLPARGTAQAVDSVQIRLRESLRRLERAPAPDTAAMTAADSAAMLRGAPGTVTVIPRGARQAERVPTDSVMAAILGLTGYEATRYHGTSADYDAQAQLLVLQGDSTNRASIDRQGTQLTADSVIRYDQANGMIRAEGLPLFSPAEGDPVQSRRVIYDVAEQRGTALGAKTKYSQGATWYVTGDLPSVTPGIVWGVHADFTSCELDVPHFHFSANEVKIVAGSILVARPVTLYFADVPVAILPFFAQSLGSGRVSGLLTPRFGVNEIVRTSGGYNRRVSNVGFYWAQSEYSDMTLAMDWFSGNFTSLTGSFRYGWLRQFLNGDVNVRQYWRQEGGRELAFDTNHAWQMDERTSLRLAARYTSSADFVRRNTFNPLEVTQSINSTGGFDRRYGWGNVSISGNRDQFLSDDRVEMTLPTVQMNLATITLFRAPALRAKWYNNITWSAGANGNRKLTDRTLGAGDSITTGNRDIRTTTGGVRSSLGLGRLSLSQSVNVDQGSIFEIPVAAAALGLSPSGRALVPFGADPAVLLPGQVLSDVTQTNLSWSTSLGYQQTLIGSTTLTPSMTLGGSMRRSDTIDVARDRFVSAPKRFSLGASLRSDLFGFFPGFGPFEAIRHKLSPGIDFQYAPSVTSNSLQQRIFGRQAIQPRKEITLSLNQTFEAKRKEKPVDSTRVAAARLAPGAGPLPGDTAGVVGASLAPGLSAGLSNGLSTAGLTRTPRADIVTLLALRTSAVQYDFVEADSLGFLNGFRTTRIDNTISSTYLQGLSISTSHDLFADSTVSGPGIGSSTNRRFDLHLAQVNLGFSLSNRSAIVRWLHLFGGSSDTSSVAPNALEPPSLVGTGPVDNNEASIIPGVDRRAAAASRAAADVGSWSANFSYSLARPRTGGQAASQMLQMSFNLKPTTLWDLSWRTSYDLERGAFNDHSIGLTRDIHDWQARFDFAQTATGNWAFRFDVSLKANSDFKFDYRQNNLDTGQR